MKFYRSFHSLRISVAASLCLAVLLAGISMTPLRAATYYWDNNGATAGFGTASGTWAVPTTGNASQGWSTSSGGTLVPGNVTTLSGDTVNFGTASLALAAGTVTVSGFVTNTTLNVATNSPITLSGGTIVLAGTAPSINGSAQNTIINSSILLLNDTTINAPNVPTGTSAAVPFTLGGTISGAADVIFNGVQANNAYGTIILNAASTYQGSTLITTVSSTGGANNTEIFVRLGTVNALPITTVVTLDGGNGTGGGRFCELNLNGNDQTLAGLVHVAGRSLRTQRVNNTSGTASVLTVSNTANYAYGAQLVGNLALAKSGAATFTLSGTNTYTGPTTISGGTLAVGGAGRLGNGSYAANITNNAAFNYISSAAQALSGVISGSGSLTHSGAGVLTLTGTNTLPLNILSGGALSVSGSGRVSGQVSINAGGTLSLTNGGRVNQVTVNIGGAVSLPGNGTATNLTFTSTGTMSFDFITTNTVSSLTVAAANGITNNGAGNSVTINITGSVPANGTYTLINYSGSLLGSSFAAYQIGSAPVGKNYALVNTPGAVQLTVSVSPPSVRAETKADGTGVVTPANSVLVGTSVTNFAILRDPVGAFVTNTPATWMLTNITGAVAASNLVVAPDGKSAVFTPVGIGSAQILAVASGVDIVPSGTITSISLTTRPFIWVRNSEKAGILAKIATNAWATSLSNSLASRVSASLSSYLANPDSFLRTLPVNWNAAPAPTFIPGDTSDFFNLENTFNVALDCAVLYYLSGNTNYARCAADILHNSVQAFQNLAPSTSTGNGGWLIPSDLLYEARQIGCQLPVVYDFLYAYLQSNQVYDVDATNLVSFNFPDAQYVFRKYYQLVRDHGQKDSNWSALMSTCMLNSLLALDSSSERATSLQIYLTTGSSRQASLSYDYQKYVQPGDIWPESLQYSSGVGEIRTTHMVLLERFDPTLNLFGVYSNLPTSLPRISYLRYPNTSNQILFGDGPRNAGGQPFFRYELVYQHALARGRTNLTSFFGSLINGGVASGSYNRSTLNDYSNLGQHDEPLELLWQVTTIPEPSVTPEMPRTDTLPFAGIALQRNPAPANNSTYGLMCFVGGAAHVHSHASGMSMELFGLGEVMGSKAGVGTYQSTIHEKYYRLFAANNTIIVNGASQGSGGWESLAINKVQTVAMEPQAFATAVSSNFSFTCSSFADNMGANAEATQQRTLSIIRTSPTTGFYVDFFRSKSTVTNRVSTTLSGNVTNQFHDYIYHNIGTTNVVLTTNGVTLPLIGQPNRFQNDIGDTYDQPGWRYFSNTVVSYPHSQSTRAQFNATYSGTTNYMSMILPAVTNREYARVTAPPIEDYSSAISPALVVRQTGDAWDKPFAVVYEPHFNANGSTVTNVTALWRSNILVGLKIESTGGGNSRVHYVISNPNATETYTDSAIGLSFKGRFAIATIDGNGTGTLYMGSGSSLEFNGYIMASVSGANTQAQLQFAIGQPPVVTANSPVTVTSPSATLTSLVPSTGTLTPAFSSSHFGYSVTVPFAVTNLTVTPTAALVGATIRVNGSLVTSGTPSSLINLNFGTNVITTVVIAPDSSATNTYTITVNRTSDKAWDANGTTAGAGGTPTGTWGSSGFWNSDLTGGAAGTFTSGTFNYDDLFFVAAPSASSGTNAYTVTVSGAQIANSLNFQSGGAPTISGGTSITLGDGADGNGGITVPQYAYATTAQGNPTLSTPIILNNSQDWFVDTGRTLTISSAISGSGKSLTKSGTGILRLNSTNTYDGNTIVLAGTLALGHMSPLSNTASIFLGAGTTLRPEVTNMFLGSPIILGDSGDTATINAPTLNLGGGGGIVSPLTLGGPIGGDGNVIFNGSATDNTYGTIVLNAQSTYSGSTLLNATATGATLFIRLGIINALPPTTVLTIDGGNGSGSGRNTQIDLNGFDQTLAGLTNVPRTLRIQRVVNRSATYAVLTIDNSEDYTFSGLLGSASGSTGGVNFGLTKRGPGIFNVTAATAYTGDTAVEGGTLRLVQATLNSQSTVSIASDAVLQLDFGGINRIVALLLNDTNQVGGIYNSNNAAPYITGPGSLEVVPFVPSPPNIESATVSGTNLVITVPTLLNLNYVLQSATNLSPTINWQSESTNTGTGGSLLLDVPIDPATPQKFLRIWVY